MPRHWQQIIKKRDRDITPLLATDDYLLFHTNTVPQQPEKTALDDHAYS
jgi:hypothetical protein